MVATKDAALCCCALLLRTPGVARYEVALRGVAWRGVAPGEAQQSVVTLAPPGFNRPPATMTIFVYKVEKRFKFDRYGSSTLRV